MASPWNSIFFETPNNNQIVWVRVISIYGEPVLAKWKNNRKVFQTITTEIKFDAIYCARWKSQ